jgi:hypothetical protein
MSRSSARRAQTEPLAALAAVVVVGLALGLYADVLTGVTPGEARAPTADATLQRVHEAVTEGGVAVPGRLDRTHDVPPPGHQLNVTLSTGTRQWTTGPEPPSRAEAARRQTAVRVDEWAAPTGRLSVVVWS